MVDRLNRSANETYLSPTPLLFKRLYWSGYKGQFGLFSWPTGWFPKPAHKYGAAQLPYLINNQQNYGDSEALARAVGPKLGNLLATIKTQNNVRLFAHSMGNVVVSEALRTAGGQQLIDTYIASQAATVASAYNPFQSLIEHEDPIVGIEFSGPETAWRYYNLDNQLLDTEFDMPPNYFSYNNIPPLHGATSPDYEITIAQQENWGAAYYANIGLAAGKIINFYNEFDAALTGWELNQLTKPDFVDGPTWEYNWDCLSCGLLDYPEYEDGDQVVDIYTRDSQSLTIYGEPLVWDLQVSVNDLTANADILGHIIPARTNALGQVSGEGAAMISDSFNLNADLGAYSYGDSNQGHSAQFYSNFFERQGYWKQLLVQFNLIDQ